MVVVVGGWDQAAGLKMPPPRGGLPRSACRLGSNRPAGLTVCRAATDPSSLRRFSSRYMPRAPFPADGPPGSFYQLLPHQTHWSWGLAWGHVVSTDLVTWKRLPPALLPGGGSGGGSGGDGGAYDSGGCFSGCSLVDERGVPTILYTGVRLRPGVPPDAPGMYGTVSQLAEERQLLARAANPDDPDLLTWVKQPRPWLDAPPPDVMPYNCFRDPFLLAAPRPGDRPAGRSGGGGGGSRAGGNAGDGEAVVNAGDGDAAGASAGVGCGRRWVVALGCGRGDYREASSRGCVLTYSSDRLEAGWRFEGLLAKSPSPLAGAVWECPVLVQLPRRSRPSASSSGGSSGSGGGSGGGRGSAGDGAWDGGGAGGVPPMQQQQPQPQQQGQGSVAAPGGLSSVPEPDGEEGSWQRAPPPAAAVAAAAAPPAPGPLAAAVRIEQAAAAADGGGGGGGGGDDESFSTFFSVSPGFTGSIYWLGRMYDTATAAASAARPAATTTAAAAGGGGATKGPSAGGAQPPTPHPPVLVHSSGTSQPAGSEGCVWSDAGGGGGGAGGGGAEAGCAFRLDLESAAGPYPLDLGDVLYAPNVLKDAQGRVVMWAWLRERHALPDAPAAPATFAGAISVPRLLTRGTRMAPANVTHGSAAHPGAGADAGGGADADGGTGGGAGGGPDPLRRGEMALRGRGSCVVLHQEPLPELSRLRRGDPDGPTGRDGTWLAAGAGPTAIRPVGQDAAAPLNHLDLELRISPASGGGRYSSGTISKGTWLLSIQPSSVAMEAAARLPGAAYAGDAAVLSYDFATCDLTVTVGPADVIRGLLRQRRRQQQLHSGEKEPPPPPPQPTTAATTAAAVAAAPANPVDTGAPPGELSTAAAEAAAASSTPTMTAAAAADGGGGGLPSGCRRVGGCLAGQSPGQPLELRLLLDHSLMEAFATSSGEALTTRINPPLPLPPPPAAAAAPPAPLAPPPAAPALDSSPVPAEPGDGSSDGGDGGGWVLEMWAEGPGGANWAGGGGSWGVRQPEAAGGGQVAGAGERAGGEEEKAEGGGGGGGGGDSGGAGEEAGGGGRPGEGGGVWVERCRLWFMGGLWVEEV
ncbi:hypothetical protein PLESTM_000333000 [Pleodorina starrii]|nr:hypothetical protein PLESTM_000333000 [Pleodorina starrii]